MMGWKETEKQTIESTTNAGADCHVEEARDQDTERTQEAPLAHALLLQSSSIVCHMSVHALPPIFHLISM